MLTKLTIRNFKRFGDSEVKIELGDSVVFIGPNNAGKTTAMQALALWHVGVQRWHEKRKGSTGRKNGKGVTIGRRDLVSIPVPHANLLWHRHHTRNVHKAGGKQKTENIRIDVLVEGIGAEGRWVCGLEFDYANEESFYCRPLRTDPEGRDRMPVPDQAGLVQVAFLSPMSGLAAAEPRLEPGAVNVKIGEGRTAEILRNLCYQIAQDEDRWNRLVERVESLFGVRLERPRYVPGRGEFTMSYEEVGIQLDLSSSGRGLQQTLLILAHMYAHPGAVLLIDEPDAHLEILRQRDIYSLLAETISAQGNQIIVASHSEVILNEAVGKDDPVVAFVGRPHRMPPGGRAQVLKALTEIGFEHYYLAEQRGWVLYLEGPTDLQILQAFAKRLGHQAAIKALERPFVHYVGNQPGEAAKHYFGLREALPKLRGIALFDRLEIELQARQLLRQMQWKRREIESYLCTRATLEAYARAEDAEMPPSPLFAESEAGAREQAMRWAMEKTTTALEELDKPSPWKADSKVSDDFLVPLFKSYFKKLGLPNCMPKRNFYQLVAYIPEADLRIEVASKLDAIAQVAKQARPRA